MDSENLSVFSSPAYRRSKNAYNWECAFEYHVGLVLSGSILAKLLTYVGMSDALTGVVSSLISLALLIQLLSVPVVSRIRNTKRSALLFHSGGEIFFSLVYLVPFLPGVSDEIRQVVVICCVLLGFFGRYFITSTLFRWGNSFVDPHERGKFFASKMMRSLLTGLIVQLGTGYLVDRFTEAGSVRGAFLFCAASICVYSVCDTICILSIQNEPIREKSEDLRRPMKEILAHTLGVKGFRKVMLVFCLYYAAVYSVAGFLGTYQIQELGFSMTVVQLLSIGQCLVWFGFCRLFGRIADRTSYAKSARIAFLVEIGYFGFLILVAPGTRWLMIPALFFSGAANAGMSSNLLMMMYSYVESDYFSEATAICMATGGTVGFLVSLVCGEILSAVQANGNQLFGLAVYGQQVQAVLGAILIVAAVLLTKFGVEKERILRQ